MLQQLTTITRNTFTESIRQPIFLILTLTASLALVLNPSLAAYTLEDDNKLLLDLGLSTLFLTGLLLAAFTASASIGKELENKTALTVVSKPVPRPIFVIGKYLGSAAAVSVAMWILTAVFLLTIRHRVIQTVRDPFDGPVLTFSILAALAALCGATIANYLYRWVFTSTFILSLAALITTAWMLTLVIDKNWQFQPITAEFADHGSLQHGQVPIALILIYQAVMIITAVATAASTRFGQILTLVVCIVAFVLGLTNQALLGQAADHSTIANIAHRAILNLQLLWPGDALSQGHHIPPTYLALATAYTLCYTTALVCIAIALFQRRQMS